WRKPRPQGHAARPLRISGGSVRPRRRPGRHLRSDPIAVEVLLDGTALQPVMRSEVGVKGEFKSSGYAEWVGKTTSNLYVMDPGEAARLRNNPFEGLRAEPAR